MINNYIIHTGLDSRARSVYRVVVTFQSLSLQFYSSVLRIGSCTRVVLRTEKTFMKTIIFGKIGDATYEKFKKTNYTP